MNSAQPEAEGVLVGDGRIELVGRGEDLRAAADEVVELGDDELLLPAFIDAHHHFCMAALDRGTPDLHDVPSIAELLQHVEAAAREGSGWVRLQGYDTNKLAEHRAPTARELDEACPDRPLVLLAYSFHDACLNTRGL